MNLLEDRSTRLMAIEVVTHVGEFTMRDSQHLACVILQPKGIKLPKFIGQGAHFERISYLAGAQDIELGSNVFDKRFNLKEDEKAIRAFFSPGCLAFLEAISLPHGEQRQGTADFP